MTIEARYCIRIDFQYPTYAGSRRRAIDAGLYDLVGGMGNLDDLNIFRGNSCCDPYLTCWSSLAEDAEFAQDQIIKLLVEEGCTVEGYTP
jgi:hypothetical protein